ncbi:MAG: DUF885 domain-containing protein [Candidatus Bipolaricaulis sp.]|nr:DUF885 domain-containing protein [Candidatus Bipolaricaulis sp.]MDD5646369.1 DUF885 domain-containing protein [Candidatus Bipolaricaulis sp.]
MTRWVLLLLAVAALFGLVFLEQTPMTRTAAVPAARPSAAQAPTPSTATPAAAKPLPTTTPADPWKGLSLEQFLNDADMSLVRLSPETITFYGLAEELGLRNNHLDPMTVEAENAYYAQYRKTAEHLASYDLSKLDAAERTNVRIYAWGVDDVLASREFQNDAYLISSYMDSYPTNLEWFLTSIHPLATLADAEDYVSRLAEIPVRFREVEERLTLSQEIGAVPPRFMLRKAVEQLRMTAAAEPTETTYYVVLDEAFASMAGVRKEDQDQVLAEAADTLETYVLPAYRDLADQVLELAARASEDAGVWKHKNGAAYYEHLLKSYTTTSLAADEIFALGLAEVARIQAEIQTASVALGFAPGLSMPDLFEQLEEKTGSSLGDDTLARCEALLDDIGPRIASAFVRVPTGELEVVDGGADTYFSPGTPDGSRPGMFFAPTATPQPIYELPTVTYHEGIPGHGFQAAYAYSAGLPPYLTGMSFTAYSEGWALYAERLAWELGVYADDPYANLGRLQDELFRAVRLVVDPGIHVRRWTYDQAVEYMVANTGLDGDYVRSEVERYIVWPAQAVTYKIGMLKILELRARAEEKLGTAFRLAEFHDVLLGHGEVPLEILEELVDEYIAEHAS